MIVSYLSFKNLSFLRRFCHFLRTFDLQIFDFQTLQSRRFFAFFRSIFASFRLPIQNIELLKV